MADRAALRINPRLTNIAAGYGAPSLSWIERAFPVVYVDEAEFEYEVYGAEHLNLIEDPIGPNTMPWPEVNYDVTTATGHTTMHGLMAFVERRSDQAKERRDSNRKTLRATYNLQLNRAYAIVAAMGDAATWTNTVNSADLSSDSIDPQAEFRTHRDAVALRTGGIYPNVCWIGIDVVNKILRNAKVRDDIKYTRPPTAPTSQNDAKLLAEYLGFDEVFIPNVVYNNDNEASTTLARAWPAAQWAMYVRDEATPDVEIPGRMISNEVSPAFARLFYCTEAPGTRGGIGVYDVANGSRGIGGTEHHVFHDYAFEVCFQAGGLLGTGALS